MQITPEIERRYWSKVDRSGECWEWLASKNHKGYGQFHINRHPYRAHRIAIFVDGSDIPSGMMVCHSCDNPGCVNPDHLFLGVDLDNVRDMHEKGRARVAFGESHCRAKITENDVRFIRSSGLSNKDLSNMFGVTTQAIGKIKHRKRWKHVK